MRECQGLTGSNGIVPLHVIAQCADIEQIAGAVFELMAGVGDLEPGEYEQNRKACGLADLGGTQRCRICIRHCRRLLLANAETWVFGIGQLYIESPCGAKRIGHAATRKVRLD
jgi:hypothetical protein